MLCCDSWDGNNYVYCRFICFFIGLFIEYFLFVFLKDCFLGGKERERERERKRRERGLNKYFNCFDDIMLYLFCELLSELKYYFY